MQGSEDEPTWWGEDAEASGVAGMTLTEAEHTDFLDFVNMCADAGRATILQHLGLKSGSAAVKGALSNVLGSLVRRYYPGMPLVYDSCNKQGVVLVINLSNWLDSLDDGVAPRLQHIGGLFFSLRLVEDGENRIEVVDQPMTRER